MRSEHPSSTRLSIAFVITGTVPIVLVAGSMKRYRVRLSVCPSVYPIRLPHFAAAGLLLRARQAGDIDRLLRLK